MRRDVDALAGREFDVLVVGGGMHGAWIATRAAEAGYSVALIEKADFAGATSANSLKILHGGLRYLQHLDFQRMRASIAARREFARQSPHLFQPLPCLMPLGMGGLKNPAILGAALLANDLISAARNSGVAAEAVLPAGRLVSGAACRQAISVLAPSTAVAGAQWWDGLALDTGRLAMETLLRAARAGAVVANRVEALGLRLSGSRVHGVDAADLQGGKEFQIRARTVIDASGPWIGTLSRKAGLTTQSLPPGWIAGMNIVLRRSLGLNAAVALSGTMSGQKRELFFVPWRGVTMVGTHYEPLASGEPGEAPREAIDRFVAQIAQLAPRAGIGRDDVALVHWGAMPLGAATDTLPARSATVASGLAEAGAHGLVLMVAEKLTSAPQTSLRVLDRIRRELPAPPPGRPRPIPAAEVETHFLQPQAEVRLRSRYGSAWPAVLKHASSRRELLQPIAAGSDVLAVEVVHAIREEMALSVDDLARRRLGLADAGAPQPAVIAAVAALAESEWRQQALRDVPGSSSRDSLAG